MVVPKQHSFGCKKLKSPSSATCSSPTSGQVGRQITIRRGYKHKRVTSISISLQGAQNNFSDSCWDRKDGRIPVTIPCKQCRWRKEANFFVGSITWLGRSSKKYPTAGKDRCPLCLIKFHSLRFQMCRACFRLPSVGGKKILSGGIHGHCS